MNLETIFETMIAQKASDSFLRAGDPPWLRVRTELVQLAEEKLTEKDMKEIVGTIIIDERGRKKLEETRHFDRSMWHGTSWRFRIGVFYQQEILSIVIRKIDLSSLTFAELGLPEAVLKSFCNERRGLILLTGMTGSGKSTTIASMVEYINQNHCRHIVTLEDPVEVIFKNKKSLVSQREIGSDVMGYEDALAQLATHSPDVIYIGTINSAKICEAALRAAEMGAFVVSTLHSVNARSTVESLINYFSPEHHARLFDQLSFLLKGVISQRLIPRCDQTGIVLAYEIMSLSPTVSSLIKENKISELPKCIGNSAHFGMNTFNKCLYGLLQEKKISLEMAMQYSDEKKELEVMINYGSKGADSSINASIGRDSSLSGRGNM